MHLDKIKGVESLDPNAVKHPWERSALSCAISSFLPIPMCPAQGSSELNKYLKYEVEGNLPTKEALLLGDWLEMASWARDEQFSERSGGQGDCRQKEQHEVQEKCFRPRGSIILWLRTQVGAKTSLVSNPSLAT